jgi:predicted pyridoxine 5'-phosphate oxidase superfamily flavin-nucleotide-binding protein
MIIPECGRLNHTSSAFCRFKQYHIFRRWQRMHDSSVGICQHQRGGLLMRRRFFELAFTPAVKAVQSRRGSRDMYARAGDTGDAQADLRLGAREAAFLSSRDSFYLASVSETGWPYIQHRGGPPGFLRVLDDRTIGWAELRGNRQYITTGNVSGNDRVALFFMDYAARRRLKLLGRMQVLEAAARPELALAPDLAAGAMERWALVRVEAFDWNCPQYITPRYTVDELEAASPAGPGEISRPGRSA